MIQGENWLPWVTQRADDPELPEMAALSAELRQRGIVVWDLAEEFRRWPIDRQDRLFLPADAHYSEAGNRMVAEMIYERLRAGRRSSAVLSAAGKSREGRR